MPWSKRVASLPEWARAELEDEVQARILTAAAVLRKEGVDLREPTEAGLAIIAEVYRACLAGVPFVVEELQREAQDREAGRILTEEGVGYESQGRNKR